MIYELIVIGGGPAGYLAAERAGHAGLSTLLIEKRSLGGVCLNEGCIPTKTLLYSAKIFDNAKHGGKYGVTAADAKLDHRAVVNRKNKVVRNLVAGIKAKMKKNNVTVVQGEGRIAGRSLEGYEVKVGDTSYTGRRLLIATGSVPILPPIPGVKEGLETGFVLTNREILDLTEVPAKLVIVGGGVIGLEMASYFQSAGSNVTVIEMLDHIAGNTDAEISQILLKNYQKKGVRFLLNSKVTKIEQNAVICESGGQTFSVEADKVLMSIGRRAATEGLGLETIGVELERGRVKTDSKCQTNVPGVYAAGDVNGVSMLAHTAYREAEVAINNILGKKDIMRYHAIPSVIYTNPEVAGVGETEESASKKGIEFEAAKLPMMYSGRYMAENEGGDGICKVLVDKKHRKLIGVHMIGNYSSEIIYGAALMIELEMRVDDVKELVFPHPTVSEIIRETIFEL
ncbi:MAG TPA: dihydrolipoyl dehydrogenase [Clostridiales bacterium]|nr:dihydrolipoyl dehydrogenase [Clostridiales bacterium]